MAGDNPRQTSVACAGCGTTVLTSVYGGHNVRVIPPGWARLNVTIRGVNDPTQTQKRQIFACSPECAMDGTEDDFDKAAERG